MADPRNSFIPWGRASDPVDDNNVVEGEEDSHLFYDCTDGAEAKKGPYMAIRFAYGACIFAYFVATIGFMAAAVFGDAEPDAQIRWTKVFMWNSFIYPILSRALLLVDIMIIHGDCESTTELRERFNHLAFYVAVLSMLNGFVAIVILIIVQGQNMKDEDIPQPNDVEIYGKPSGMLDTGEDAEYGRSQY